MGAHGGGKKPLFDASLSTFVRCRIVATEKATVHVASQWLEARLLVLVKKLDHMNARPLRRPTEPFDYIIGTSGQMLAVQQAVDEFQEMIGPHSEEDGENWQHVIEIQVCGREA